MAGVIVNRVNGDTWHFQLLKSAIERYCRVPVLGYVPRVEGVALPEQHGISDSPRVGGQSAGMAGFRQPAGAHPRHRPAAGPQRTGRHADRRVGEQLAADAGEGLTLALADDAGLQGYFLDNLALLARCGVKMVRFSPLRNRQLPACQMIWLGGGYTGAACGRAIR